MIPIRDTERSRIFPIMNWVIILINVFVFLLETTLPQEMSMNFIYRFALIPSEINFSNPLSLLPFLTHMFLHAGWFHILSNMWILLIFGDNIEERMGPIRYLFFYLVGGIAAGVLQYYLSSSSAVPTLGASGAVAAVMGAYFVLYPRAKVLTFIPIFIFGGFVHVSAVVFLGFWFVTQLFSGLASISVTSAMQAGGVAWFAHIGGFVFGLLAVRLLTKKEKFPYQADEYYSRWQG